MRTKQIFNWAQLTGNEKCSQNQNFYYKIFIYVNYKEGNSSVYQGILNVIQHQCLITNNL